MGREREDQSDCAAYGKRNPHLNGLILEQLPFTANGEASGCDTPGGALDRGGAECGMQTCRNGRPRPQVVMPPLYKPRPQLQQM